MSNQGEGTKVMGGLFTAALAFAFIPTIWALVLAFKMASQRVALPRDCGFLFCYALLMLMFFAATQSGSYGAVIFASMCMTLYAWFSHQADKNSAVGLKNHVRGSNVVDAAAVIQQYDTEITRDEKEQGYKYSDKIFRIGGVPIANETEHFLFAGKTGAGKSQAISALLETAQRRELPAIIADPGGDYYSRFARDGDLLFNPLDARSVAWSPFAEIRNRNDCQRIAKAIIPDTGGSGAEWRTYAQSLLGELLAYQHTAGDYRMRELTRLMSAATPSELAEHLADTPAAAMCAENNERMLGSVRATATPNMAWWPLLTDQGDFSVRDFIQHADDGQSRWLFITYRDDQLAQLRNLVSALIDVAIIEMLSLDDAKHRRIIIALDELDALGPVATLGTGLTKLRKYGGIVVSGIQTIAQLRNTYGKDQAQTLLSCMSTKLLLAAGDNETAEYFSREIGDQETSRRTESQSSKSGAITDMSTTTGQDQRTERTILPSQITGLANLEGFLRTPEISSIVRVQIKHKEYAKKTNAFQPAV